MQKMSFWNKAKNNISTQKMADQLAEKEDRVFLRGNVQKNDYSNNTNNANTKYQYTGLNESDDDNSGGKQMSLSQGLGLMKDIKGYTGGGGSGAGGGTPWGAIAGVARSGYDTITGKDGTEYSDLEQSTIYPVQGAAIGSQFGPWGAAGGALYGLGYSFKDDIGLDDNDWLTTVLFPIGMGDEHQGLIQL